MKGTVHMEGRAANKARDPAELGPPALRAFFRLAEVGALTEREQVKLLGLSSSSDLQRWRSGQDCEVDYDTLERISCLLGIFQAISTLLPEPDRVDAWMRAPNQAPTFDGRSALEKMTSGSLGDLHAVRRYLDAERS